MRTYTVEDLQILRNKFIKMAKKEWEQEDDYEDGYEKDMDGRLLEQEVTESSISRFISFIRNTESMMDRMETLTRTVKLYEDGDATVEEYTEALYEAMYNGVSKEDFIDILTIEAKKIKEMRKGRS